MGKKVNLVMVSTSVRSSEWTDAETNISPSELVKIALEALPKVLED